MRRRNRDRTGAGVVRRWAISTGQSREAERRQSRAILRCVDHGDHVRLIRDAVGPPADASEARVWADLGSGRGAFTLALADLLGPGGVIHSVDRDAEALRAQAAALRRQFPSVAVKQVVADFSAPVDLPQLDGIVMANSLHFELDKLAVLELVRAYLRPDGGRLVLVEYDSDSGNPWVPYPLSFRTWQSLAAEAGFRGTRKVASVPSRFLGAIYSAVSFR